MLLQDQIHSRWSDIESAFATMDSSGKHLVLNVLLRRQICLFLGDGLISLDEFSRLINELGLDHATPGSIVALFNKYSELFEH